MIQDTEATMSETAELKNLVFGWQLTTSVRVYLRLATCSDFPIDILKIDKSFIEKIGQGKEGKAVARR